MLKKRIATGGGEGGRGNICGGICVLYTYDVCLREEAQPGVGRGGGKQIWCTLRPNSVCFENVPQMRYFALCVLNIC